MRIYKFGFTIYGVKVGIETNRKYFFERIKADLPALLPFELTELKFEETDRRFALKFIDKNAYKVEVDSERTHRGFEKESAYRYFLSHLRVKIAEYAEERVFVHAGAVGWKGRAILIPAKSFKGKTTLVAELVKIGAEYYSDEYAVLDREGLVHPFPKMISMRGIIDKRTQKDIPPENFGRIGKEPIPVGLILFTEFEEGARWKPEKLTIGQGILEMLPHTLPIRYKTEFSLFVLYKTLSRAIILKSKRSRAPRFAEILTEYFDGTLTKT